MADDEAGVDAQALLQCVRAHQSASGGGPLVAQEVFDALQGKGEPWASASLSRVRKACAKVNKDDAAAQPPAAPPAKPRKSASAAAAQPAPAGPPVDVSSLEGNDLLRAAYTAFRDREMRWLYALPTKRQAQLFDNKSTGPSFPAQHVMHNGEVALLLAGLKPCVLFAHFAWQGSASEPSFGALLAKEVIRPWLEDFQLGPKLGLSLHELKGDQVASDDFSGGRCRFRGSWVLLAERDPMAAEARRVWLTPGSKHATLREQGVALGYPGLQMPDSDCCRVFYMAVDKAPFVHPSRNANQICCCVFTEYNAISAGAAAVGDHFKASLAALREKIGVEIYLDLEDMGRWPAHATALCCAKAFGSTDNTVEACTKPPSYLKLWTKDKRMGHALVLVDDCATALRAVGSRVRITAAGDDGDDPTLNGAEGVGLAFEGRGDLDLFVQVQLTAPPEAVAAHAEGKAWARAHLVEVVPSS